MKKLLIIIGFLLVGCNKNETDIIDENIEKLNDKFVEMIKSIPLDKWKEDGSEFVATINNIHFEIAYTDLTLLENDFIRHHFLLNKRQVNEITNLYFKIVDLRYYNLKIKEERFLKKIMPKGT